MFFKQKPKCPYCNIVLENFEYRSKKCPSCKNKIILIKDSEKRNISKVKKILIKEVDEKNQKLKNMYFDSFRDTIKWDYLVVDRDRWFKKFPQSSYGDLIHSTYQRLINEGAKLLDINKMISLYIGNAKFLSFEGKPYKHLLKESNKLTIKNYKKSGVVEKIAWLPHPNACAKCKELEDVPFEISKALRKSFPPKDCTCEPLEAFGSTFLPIMD